MPAYQQIEGPINPTAQAVGNFGAGFAESIKKAKERERKLDLLNEILGTEARDERAGPVQAPPQRPDNLQPILKSVKNHPDLLAREGIVAREGYEPQRQPRITPEKMAKLEITSPELAKAFKPIYEQQSKKELEATKADVKRSGEFFKKIDQAREGIGRKELSLGQIDEAIKSRSGLDTLRDMVASASGNESFRSAKGAQPLSATKEFFLGDLASIPGVRPNQFLERTLASAFTDPARTQEANEMVAAGMRSNLALDKLKIQLTDQIEDSYRQAGQPVPGTISRDVANALTPYAQQLQDQWANEVQHIKERHDSQLQNFKKTIGDPVKMKSAAKNIKLRQAIPGAILDDTMGRLILEKYGGDQEKAEEAALKLGYIVPEK